MSINPLSELKRHLEEDSTPLPKRLCLAKNIIQSHHFPTAPKERIVGQWLYDLTVKNLLSSTDLRNILHWFSDCDDATSELKTHLIQVVAQYVQSSLIQNHEMQNILLFLENTKISTQLCQQIDYYLTIVITILQCLKGEYVTDVPLCQKIFENIRKYYKECKKKLEFIVKLLQEGNLETIFSFLDTECRSNVIDVCKNVLFPINKRTFFISYLQTLIRKDNIDELIAEKGDNIQSVIKIMNAIFEYPKVRVEKDSKFVRDFIDVFVCSFRNESQIIFAFYIMVANFLNMPQNYIVPAMNINSLNFKDNDEKIKRNLFLNMLEILLENEADINVRLTDTFGERISKVEIKKNFMSFLQVVMMGQLKLHGKLDKTTLQIIKTGLKLDPMLIEQKINDILPPIMSAKKNNPNIMKNYTDMMNCLLEILFKLSRGTSFLNQILPFVKTNLEASNTEQFEYKQTLEQSTESLTDDKLEKIKGKIITGRDIFPDECVETYGKFTSELMFRQNKEHLELLQKNFEEHCLLMLEEGFVSPSIITLTEVLSAILSSFFRHNKMADHTVPLPIAQDFWNSYQKFENECVRKFGECILKLSYNPPLVKSFLNLCIGFAQLKLLNLKYGNVKIDITESFDSDIFDFTVILPCLNKQQWMDISSSIKDGDVVLLLNNLLTLKTMAIEMISITSDENNDSLVQSIKTHIIKQLSTNQDITKNYFAKILFDNLDKTQAKQLAKCLYKMFTNESDIFSNEAVCNNKTLLNALVLETVKNLMKCFEGGEILSKCLNKHEISMASFAKENNIKEYFQNLSFNEEYADTVKNCLELLQKIPVPYLEENYQLVAIFALLAIKKCCQSKKTRRHADNILQSIYELSLQPPDLYQIFPVKLIFSFEDDAMLKLLTLTIKTSNNMLIIKSMIESAVKRVRTDNDIVKNIVNIILNSNIQKSTSIDVFNNSVFQIICIILPLIVKQKKVITASAHRSILADLQEKLQNKLVNAFKNIDFSQYTNADNTDDVAVESEISLATLNAMAAYSLTLSKFFETNDDDEMKSLGFTWHALEFFVKNAIKSIQDPGSKPHHVESSIQLLNVMLRHIKKLEMHELLKEKDKLFLNIWNSVKSRLKTMYAKERLANIEEIGVTVKFLCELSSVECFVSAIVGDLTTLVVLEKPIDIIKDENNTNKVSLDVSKYVWTQCLKANIVGPKCVALAKLMYRTCKNLRFWIRQHYEVFSIASKKRKKVNLYTVDEFSWKVFKMDDKVCGLLKIYLDTLTEVIFAAKKMTIDYKFIDSIFCLQHMMHYILGDKGEYMRCEVSWPSFFELYNGCLAILNSLLVAREEQLEDRWPNYMQCYRVLITVLCERSNPLDFKRLDKTIEDKLAETAHNVEKLTQSISKRRKHVSRIAAYTVGDICSVLERSTPTRMVRQHLENSIVMLIQASDTSYVMAFLKRSLAGTAGHTTMTNMYNVYKKYHKYVGNA